MKKLTITVPEEVYEGLHSRIGPRNISRFLTDLARPHVVAAPAVFSGSLEAAYAEKAGDEQAELEALAWVESAGETLPDEDFSAWPGRKAR